MGAFADHSHALQMRLVNGLEKLLHFRKLHDFRQRPFAHPPDNVCHHIGALRVLNDQGQFHRGRGHFDGRFRVLIERSVNDIGPLHQLVEVGRSEAEAVSRNVADEFGATPVSGVVEFLAAAVA